jgi:hypothetical protein
MGGACSTNGEKKNAYMLLVGMPEGKRPLGRSRRWWVNNIRMDIVEVGWGDVDWIGLVRDKVQAESWFHKCWETIECPNN